MPDETEQHQTWGSSFDTPKQYYDSTYNGSLAVIIQYGNLSHYFRLFFFIAVVCWCNRNFDIFVANESPSINDDAIISTYNSEPTIVYDKVDGLFNGTQKLKITRYNFKMSYFDIFWNVWREVNIGEF